MFVRIRAAIGHRPALGAVRLAAVGVLILSACSTDNPLSLRPDVDIGTTASFADASDADIGGGQGNYIMPTEEGLSSDADYGGQDTGYGGQDTGYAGPGDESYASAGSTLQQQAEQIDMASADRSMMSGADSMSDGGDVSGDGAGASIEPIDSQPVMAGSEMAGSEMAGGDGREEPGVSQYRVDDVNAIGLPGQAARSQPDESYDVASVPRMDEPDMEPVIEPEPEPEPYFSAHEVKCRAGLKQFDVVYKDLQPIHGGRSCGIDRPVKVSAIGRVKISPAATLTCDMALTFAAWTKKELVPAARRRYLTGVKTIHQASSYSCRNIAGSRTLSEHGKGNAIDISRIELKSGRDIDVRKQGLFAFRAKGLLNSVRADGCEYFSTVLGPGYNHDHRDHFHFDIKERRSGRRACH